MELLRRAGKGVSPFLDSILPASKEAVGPIMGIRGLNMAWDL